MKTVRQQFLESLRQTEKILDFRPGAGRGDGNDKGKWKVDMPGSDEFTYVKADESHVAKLFDYMVKNWDDLAGMIDADPNADPDDVHKRLFNFVYGSAQWYNEENHDGNKLIEFSDENFETVARRLYKECQDGRLDINDLIRAQEG